MTKKPKKTEDTVMAFFQNSRVRYGDYMVNCVFRRIVEIRPTDESKPMIIYNATIEGVEKGKR